MIRVLVVEDSPIILEFLLYILNSESNIQVVGTAHNGEAAVEAVKRYKPDIITMDIHMPKMNGFEATRKIMETVPTPIIIVSGSSALDEASITFRALEAGALMVVSRPTSIGHEEHEITVNELIKAIHLMSEVKVVRRWPKTRKIVASPSFVLPAQRQGGTEEIKIVAIGASTGGPIVLQTILNALPANFPVPIVIVQHMAVGFVKGFAEWLGQTCLLNIKIALHGEVILPGQVYIAPDGNHLRFGIGNQIILTKNSSENGHCPSISYCFHSVAEVYGKSAIAILLSGMGKDGAAEMKLIQNAGAITIAQDEESSVVFGMPKEAINLGAVQFILNPNQISDLLKELVCHNTL